MKRRLISAALALIGTAIGLIVSASKTRDDIIELERQKAEAETETEPKEHKTYRLQK